jgi:hypothetical protein
MDLNRRDIALIDLIISIHLKFADPEEQPPQADLDHAEGPLRTALQTGKVKSYLDGQFGLFDQFDRQPIPEERWSEQDFWIAAHTDPFRWQGEYWHIMLDADDLAATDISAPFSQERIWIEQAPESIRRLMVYKYLQMMLELWPTVRDQRTAYKEKEFPRHMAKHKISDWSDLSGPQKDALYIAARPPSLYAERAKQARQRKQRSVGKADQQ